MKNRGQPPKEQGDLNAYYETEIEKLLEQNANMRRLMRKYRK